MWQDAPGPAASRGVRCGPGTPSGWCVAPRAVLHPDRWGMTRGGSGFFALDGDPGGRLEAGRRDVADVGHERGGQRRRGGHLLVGDRQDPEPPELRQLVADVGLEHLRAVGVDREPDLVAPEGVEDPAELVPARDDPRVQVGGRADLEDDARGRGSSPSPAGRRRPSRRDPIRSGSSSSTTRATSSTGPDSPVWTVRPSPNWRARRKSRR